MNQPLEGPEFLIRTGGDNFRLKKVSGLEASSFFRPCRVSEDRYEVKETQEDGVRAYLVKNAVTGKIISLSEMAFDLWKQMDGRITLRSLTAGCFLKYGIINFSEIRLLIQKLHNNGLIETRIPPLIRVHRVLERSRNPVLRLISKAVLIWGGIGFNLRDVDRKIGRLYAKVSAGLFNRPFFVSTFIVSSFAAFVFAGALIRLEYDISSFLDSPWKWAFAYMVIVVHIPFHELAHALTAKHFGYEVRGFGFALLHNLFPVFYADVTDIWMAPARQRMAVASAGIFVDWVFGSIAILFSFLFPNLRFLMYLIAFNSYAAAIINLYPFFFLELDGYYILTDLLKMPHLRKEAIQLLRGHLKKRWIYPGFYGLISFISIGLIFWYIVWSFLN